ncbi:MAG: hypothetical protein ACYS8I_00640 [Planctomycetota bacterium]
MLDITTIASDWRLADIPNPPKERGYITVVSSDRPIGKRFFVSDDGPEKKPLGESGRYRAKTIRCRHLSRFEKILRGLKKNQALINGFVPGTENGKPFYIDTEKNLRTFTAIPPDQPRPQAIYVSKENVETLIVGRFKDVFANSSFLFLDFDGSSQMPAELRWGPPMEAWAKLSEMDPELRECGHLITPSSSGRVLTEEDGKHVFSSTSFHAYVQIANEDADLIQDYYVRLFASAAANGYAFHKTFRRKDGTELQRLCTIFDRSVATPGRLIFAGEPTVESPLRLGNSEPTIQIGKVPRLSSLPRPDPRRLSEYGLSIEKYGRSYVISETSLELDILIEPQYSRNITVLEYLLGDQVHVRCQTPFRESDSYAAFLSRSRRGIPFLHDIGTQSNHHLSPHSLFQAIKGRFREDRLDSLLNSECMSMCAALTQIDGGWLPKLKEEAKSAGIPKGDVEKKIRSAQRTWTTKWSSHKNRLLRSESLDSTKETLIWDESRAAEICREVRRKLSQHPNENRIFNHSDRPCEILFQPLTNNEIENAVRPRPLIRPLSPITFADKVEAVYAIFTETTDAPLREVSTPRELRDRLAHDYPDDLPLLTGIVMHPVVTADGEIIVQPGYDSRSGLYVGDNIELVGLTQMVSLESAQRSYKRLTKHFLADFPFASSEDEAAGIAIPMTILCRQSLDIAPAFAISSPDYGTGKTTLARKTCAGVLGNIVAARSLPADDTELQKVIVAELLSGTEVILMDNASPKREHKSDVLAQVLTSPRFKGRLLGFNEMVNARTNVTIIATGKNLRFAADLASRFIPIRLEPRLGASDSKDFRQPEPEQWAIENRAKIVSRLLRIFKGYVDAGMPIVDLPYTRFPAWDKLVRRPLYWVSGVDICARMSEQIAEDPENERYFELLSSWRCIFRNRRVPLRQIADTIRTSMGDKQSERLLDSIEAVNASCVHRGSGQPSINNQKLSGSLRAFVDQEINGLMLKKDPDPSHSSRSSKAVKHWCVLSQEDGYKVGPVLETSDDDSHWL